MPILEIMPGLIDLTVKLTPRSRPDALVFNNSMGSDPEFRRLVEEQVRRRREARRPRGLRDFAE